MTPSPSKHTTVLGPLFAGAVLTVLLAGCTSNTTADIDVTTPPPAMENTTPPATPEPSMPPSAGDTTTPGASAYANGTYSASGEYKSPAGPELINVSLTIDAGVITDATFAGTATNPRSITFQGKFSEGFKEAVVGKSIDDVSLTVVNGSSLTPGGFMDALAKIKAEAKA